MKSLMEIKSLVTKTCFNNLVIPFSQANCSAGEVNVDLLELM
jgi:hypothetical protein